MGAIRLAWWREALERLDHAPPPPEPLLAAIGRYLLPTGISGSALARLEGGWATLLDEVPRTDPIDERGALLFTTGATILGETSEHLPVAGALFARIDVSRRGLIDLRMSPATDRQMRIPRRLRPLTGLAALATRDLKRTGHDWEAEAVPGRALTLLRHRMTGRLIC